jgi:transposase
MTRSASLAVPDLPTGAKALRALVLATMAERDALAGERDAAVAEHEQLRAEHDALLARTERLRHLLLKLQRAQFGRKSERLPEEQFQLGLEDAETAIAQGEAAAEQHDPALRRERAARRRASRGALPAHLPRVEVELAPPDTACPCCRAAMVVKGPDPQKDSVVRWRCVDLRDEVQRRFSVTVHENTIGVWLRRMGLTRLQPRPFHPKKDPAAQEAFKETSAA